MSEIHSIAPPADARSIPDFPGYMIEPSGIVWSCKVRGSPGKTGPWHIMKLRTDRGGYYCVNLFRNSKPQGRKVHRLVLAAFVGPCPAGLMGLHRDDVKKNNHISNLYYGTPSQNSFDSIRNGRNPLCKPPHLVERSEHREIRLLRAHGIRLKTIAAVFGITTTYVWRICNEAKDS